MSNPHGRQGGLHGQLEDDNVTWELMRRRHKRDGVLSHDELLEGYWFNAERNKTNSLAARSLRVVGAILGGAKGIESNSAKRQLHIVTPDELDPIPA